MDETSRQCAHLRDPNAYSVALAAFIFVGILVSYLPQHLKIISRRTSEGLSPWWVLLGGLSSIAAIGNILVLPKSRADILCCKEISGSECAAALLGVAQIGTQWACFMFIVMLFLTFFPTMPTIDLASSTASLTPTAPSNRRDAVIVGATTLLALLAVGITSIALVAALPNRTQTWADILGSVAGVLAMIQYFPQIYFTWSLGDVKSLSIVTMLIQVPGAFLFAFSLWLRVGKDGWSTWLVYIITGILQAVVLSLAIVYHFRSRKRAARDHGHDVNANEDESTVVAEACNGDAIYETQPNETTRLLSTGQKGFMPRPIQGKQRSSQSQRQLSMLYAATPPEHDSDHSN